jgi:hypothetical protein
VGLTLGDAVTDDVARRPANAVGRSFLLSLAGAALGCLAVVFGLLVPGFALLLLTPYGVVLIVAALFATFLSAVFARLWPRRLGARAILVIAAVFTIMLFAALPLSLVIRNWGRGVTGPMFG